MVWLHACGARASTLRFRSQHNSKPEWSGSIARICSTPRADSVDTAKAATDAKEAGKACWNISSLRGSRMRSEEHTSELQSQSNLVCRLLLEKKKTNPIKLFV